MLIINLGMENQIYNISGDEKYKNIDVCNVIVNKFSNYDHYFGTDLDSPLDNFFDFNVTRKGQDLRYSIDDSKIRALGWLPNKKIYQEIPDIVNYYKENFIW